MLIDAGKAHWVRVREDNVVAKGKGVLQTYWITPHAKKGTSNASSETGTGSGHNLEPAIVTATDQKTKDLLRHESQIDWIVEMLQERIRNIVAHRDARKKQRQAFAAPPRKEGSIALDEVVEIIKLPDFDHAGVPLNSPVIEVDDNIAKLLREFVAIVSEN